MNKWGQNPKYFQPKVREFKIIDGILNAQCSACKKWKPATHEFFPRDIRYTRNIMPQCHICQKKRKHNEHLQRKHYPKV